MSEKYPMTFEEFDKRVRELLIDGYSEEEKKSTLTCLDVLLEEDPDFIKNLYRSACGYYDRKELNWDKIFDDPLLLSRPVSTLQMLC